MHIRSAVAGASATLVAGVAIFAAVAASNAAPGDRGVDTAPTPGHYSTLESQDPIEYVPAPEPVAIPEPVVAPEPAPVVVEEPVVTQPAPQPAPAKPTQQPVPAGESIVVEAEHGVIDLGGGAPSDG